MKKVLRKGRYEDFEKVMSFRKIAFQLLAAAAICIIGTPLLVMAAFPLDNGATLLEMGRFAVIVTYIIESFSLLIDYSASKNPKYHLADVPKINGWQWVRILWASAVMPIMLVSFLRMKRTEARERQESEQDLRDLQVIKQHFTNCNLRDDSNVDDSSLEALEGFCCDYWYRWTTETREQKILPRTHELEEIIAQRERELAEARAEQQSVLKWLKRHPEGVEPNESEQKMLAETFERLKEIPEVVWLKGGSKFGQPHVEVTVDIRFVIDEQQACSLGIYNLIFYEGQCTGEYLLSGFNILGKEDFPQMNSLGFLESVIKESLSDSADDFIPTTIKNFVKVIRQEKIHRVGRDNLARYTLPVEIRKSEKPQEG